MSLNRQQEERKTVQFSILQTAEGESWGEKSWIQNKTKIKLLLRILFDIVFNYLTAIFT